MATPSISGGSLQRVRSLVQQWEATHGRKVTPDVSRAFMEAELSAATKGAQEGARIEQRQSEINFNQAQALKKEQQQEKASQVQGGVQGALLAKELGAGKGISALFGADTATTTGTTIGGGASSVAPGVTAVPGAGAPALTGATGVGEGVGTASTAGGTAAGEGTSAGAGGGVSMTGLGIAAAVLLDAKIARDANEGEFTSLKDRNRTNVQGLEFGGVSPGAAALFQKHGVLSPEQVITKWTGTDLGPGKPLQDIADLGSDIIESVIPGGSEFMSDLGF